MRLRKTSRAGSLLLAAAALSAFAAAGCGGGGDDGLSKGELVKKANAICKRHTNTITVASSKLLAGGQLPSTRKLGKLALGTIVPETSAQVKELRALDASDDVAGDYKEWLDDSDSAVGRIMKDPSILPNPASFKRVNGQAADLGLSSDCRIGPGG